MKKLILVLLALVPLVAYAAFFDFTDKDYEVRDSSCVKVDGLTNSKTKSAATEKIVNASCDDVPSGIYNIVFKGATDCAANPTVEKLAKSCGEVIDVPPVVVEPDPLTDADCAPRIVNGTLDACIDAPVIEQPVDNIVQVEQMPAVDISQNITPATGYSELRIQSTDFVPATGKDVGASRINCAVSHMSNDDPIVYPNQVGAAHHHTFYGNTAIDANSDVANAKDYGNSTCNGGIMNRSSYWHPSLIDTRTNKPLTPVDAIWYYKSGYDGVPSNTIVAPPEGLRIIAGNAQAKTASEAGRGEWKCSAGPVNRYIKEIPNCPVGSKVQVRLGFPQCWDGVNLDSPNHQDHMAYGSGRNGTFNGCPVTHPVAIPKLTINMQFLVTEENEASFYRLSSDNYEWDGTNAGYSLHADWINGWQPEIIKKITENCVAANSDCHASLIGDGTRYY